MILLSDPQIDNVMKRCVKIASKMTGASSGFPEKICQLDRIAK